MDLYVSRSIIRVSTYVQSITAVPLNIALSFLQVRNLETHPIFGLSQLHSLPPFPCDPDASESALPVGLFTVISSW